MPAPLALEREGRLGGSAPPRAFPTNDEGEGRFCIVVAKPPGFDHAAAFEEVAQTLYFALSSLGQNVVLASSPMRGRKAIVLGAHNLPAHGLPLPDDAILYNLEQVDPEATWLTRSVLNLLSRHEVWDYSEANASRFPELGLPRPRVVPIGIVPELTRVPGVAIEDIDVLFYGSLNERRRRVIRAVRDRGLRVEAVWGLYGDARDRLIARSKVVLNMHYYNAKVFEIVRVSYLLANRRCVVSEGGSDVEAEREFGGGIAFTTYEELPEQCVRLCADPVERARIACEGYRLISKRDARRILRDALCLGEDAHAAGSATVGAVSAVVQARQEDPRADLARILEPAGKRVLDVGCGAGGLGESLLAGGAHEVVGVEQDGRALERAQTRLSATHLLNLDSLPDLPYPAGHFDLIICADALRRVTDPIGLLRRLRRWLSDSGRIVCGFPNVRHESVLLPLLLHGWWRHPESESDVQQLRFYSIESAKTTLLRAGYVPDGRGIAVTTTITEPIAKLTATVRELGGNPEVFERQARLVELVLSAIPSQPSCAEEPSRTRALEPISGLTGGGQSDVVRGMYLDLVQACLLNQIYEDPAQDPWSPPTYDAARRERGLDWPSKAHTMIGRLRMTNLRRLCERVLERDVPGDFIETGVWRGGACIYMRAIAKAHGASGRRVWVADSFRGLPPPDPSRYPADEGDPHHTFRQLIVSLEEVQRNFARYGLLDDGVRFLEGWFRDTLPLAPIERLAILRLDGDMYESTMDALVNLYDKLSPGGFVIVDDYWAVAGCRSAIIDFRKERRIESPLIDIDGMGAYWEKE